ncbi:MAG TPA: glucokinase [Burkholderiaceae bacterium]|nr:glucokinase [Burkholderiaceae bacterium]
MLNTTYPRLLGDIGGTNARFALQAHPGAEPSQVATLACAQFPGLEDAIEHYLQQQVGTAAERPHWAAIGIANPVVGDHVRMTNHHWAFSIEALRQRFGWDRFTVINDFTALALSLPALAPADLQQVGGAHAVAGAAVGLIGPGTGLGVSGLLWPAEGGHPVPINGEGGHVTLAPCDDVESAVLAVLRRRFGHVSAERAVSGPGLVNVYQALCEIGGVATLDLDASGVSSRALAGSDVTCRQALDMFCSFLGNLAGNLAVTLGARGGVYIGGGIVPRLGGAFAASPFRQRFEAKGRFQAYLEPIPVFVIQASVSPALLGAARALQD